LQGENRILLGTDQISQLFREAVLAREDSRFYQHHGVDLIGIGRALVSDFSGHKLWQGGSTITQQLARNSFDLGGRTLSRKILEAFVATRIDLSLPKEQILTDYVNRIYFGSGYYGLETASRAYFGKPAAKLNLPEAATLAGLIRSPNRYSPLNNPAGAIKQRNEVLDRMAELHKLSPDQLANAKATPLKVAEHRPATNQQNYAVDALYRELQTLVSQDAIDSGGLRIYSTLDPNLQQTAENAVEACISQIEHNPGYRHPIRSSVESSEDQDRTNYLQGAVLVMDNRSGAIRALVGGRSYHESKYNRALQAVRPVGSTFKPFIYAAAYMHGFFPGMLINDGPIQPNELPSAPNWNPTNSDHSNRGMLPLRDGLILSRNTMTIRVGERVGLGTVRDLAKKLEVARSIPPLPSTYLGSFGTTVKEITAAYSVFPAGGVHREPYLIDRIDDQDGNVIYQAHPAAKEVLNPSIAWMVSQTLRGVLERGTGASVKSLGFDKIAAGKTGTTDDVKDAWFVGYTNTLTCGVWVGFDQPETIEQKGYGATLALPIWAKIIEKAPKQRYPDGEFPAPEPLVQVRLCAVSNQLATDRCESAGTSYEISLPQSLCPKQQCTVHRGSVLPRLLDDRERDQSLPSRIFRVFRNLFGEK